MEEHEDGSITLYAEMFNGAECIAWVFGFGDVAELLEPVWLRREIRQTIGRMKGRCVARKQKVSPGTDAVLEGGTEQRPDGGASAGQYAGLAGSPLGAEPYRGAGSVFSEMAEEKEESMADVEKQGTGMLASVPAREPVAPKGAERPGKLLDAGHPGGVAEGRGAMNPRVLSALEESLAEHEGLYRELSK